jgi:hypothetical protein
MSLLRVVGGGRRLGELLVFLFSQLHNLGDQLEDGRDG